MKKTIYILIGLLGLLPACTKDFQKLNVDPNNPTEASSQSILLQAQRNISRILLDDNNVFVVLNWVQYNAPLGYREQPFDFDWNTDATYNGVSTVLRNLERLRKQAINNGHVNYEAIAMIMEAWVFSNLTDLYGDIPYSESLKGSEGILYPKYDSQQDIYNDLVIKLKDAAAKIDVLQTAGKVDGASDIFCQGDMLKWKRFANSFRARIYIRMSESDNLQAKKGLEEIFGDPDEYPVIDDNKYNVGVAFIESTPGQNNNYWVQRSRGGSVSAVSTTMVDLLCKNDDPRRKILLNPTKKSLDSVKAKVWDKYVYQGVPAVLSGPFISFSQSDVSTVGDAISLDYYRPIDLITFAEVMFIRAEGANKGYTLGDAKEYYEKGITGSMKKWGVSDPNIISQYVNGPFASYDATKAKMQILTQRYIDQFHQALNTFAMIRRSGYPNLGWISVGFATENGFPDRLPYASNMRRDPDFGRAASGVTLNLWGNVWFAKETTTVHISPAYQAPVKYQFPDK